MAKRPGEEVSQLKKKRSAIVAAMLTLFGSGAGFLYVGKIGYALGLAVAPVVIFALAAWSGLTFTAPGFYGAVSFLILLLLGAPVFAAMFAKRAGEVVLRRYQRWYFYLAWVVVFGVVTNVALENRAELFGYETFRFPSSSMRDTFLPGDFFMSNTWKYRDAQPTRGELVVFRFPPDPSTKFVKRIIGLPGESLEIKNGVVYVNGERLHEPYVRPENNVRTIKPDLRFTVPADAFFVLGDNRDHSNDSRYWGFLPKDHLHGSVEFIWFSYDQSLGVRSERIGVRVK